MMRYDEHNWHVHGSYAEETAPSSNLNVTDEDESKEIIVHKNLSENQSKDVSESECSIFHETLSENLSQDVSKSECNIVHETLLQNNSADVPDNIITELKDDEHIESSVIGKGTIYFSIF